jgi:hypothetical protein
MSLLANLFLLTAAATWTEPSGAPKSEFFELYAVTCLANVFTPAKLRETMNSPATPRIPDDEAAPLLAGKSGSVWRVYFGKGQYAVALVEPNFCAVYAPHAPIAAVTEDFSQFAAHPATPLQERQLSAAEAGPNSDDLASTAYIWQQPGKSVQILYTLTTSKAALDPPIQAMASVTVGRPGP